MCKAVEELGMEFAKRERLEAIQNMIKYGVPKEKILQDYSEEEYEVAEQTLFATK